MTPAPQSWSAPTSHQLVGSADIGSMAYVPPERTHDVLADLLPLPSDASMLVASAPADPSRSAAGLLYLESIATRPYDAVSAAPRTAFVQANVTLTVPELHAIEHIHAVIERLSAAGEVSCATGWESHELVRTAAADGRAVYCGMQHISVADRAATIARIVDQNAREDLHYGSEVALRGGRFLYQSIPSVGAGGRRETSRRWEAISSMLKRADVPLRDKVVLDIGCNAGMMLASALTDGALWGIGWDRPAVVKPARQLMYALGFTRFDLVGEDLTHDSCLQDALPQHLRSAADGCVVFYLAIRHHLGFLPDLANVPWKVMVYGGGESERAATLDRSLEDLRELCSFEVAEAVDFRARGDGPATACAAGPSLVS